MVDEHVITISEEIRIEELNYMLRIANDIGMKNKRFVRCFVKEDDQGKHFYFECEL